MVGAGAEKERKAGRATWQKLSYRFYWDSKVKVPQNSTFLTVSSDELIKLEF